MLQLKGKYTDAKIFIGEIDETTFSQIQQIVNHPTFTNPVRIMQDTHAGASNSVIGFTMKLAYSIIPNTVGVDIGCGMISAQLATTEIINFANVDEKIRRVIPIGNKDGIHNKSAFNVERNFPYDKASEKLYKFTKKFNETYNTSYTALEYNYNWFLNLCKRIDVNHIYIERSLGTLGGGNHFIEIGQSSLDNSLWLTVHSGSRNLGKKIADYHSKIAKQTFSFDKKAFEKEFNQQKEILKREKRNEEIKTLKTKLISQYTSDKPGVPDNMLFLKGENMYNYFTDMIFAQVYASENRKLMIKKISEILKINISDTIESVHNYIDFEDFIIRKGAIRAYKNQRMIIPFNMADGILICNGKSNPDWNYSAPHGAGRVLSRRKAKDEISLKNYKKIMNDKNIFTTSVNESTIDEAPQAYKKADIIENAIEPTAEILFRLKPLYNLKAN